MKMMYITTDDRSIVSALSERSGTTSALTFETSDLNSLQFAKASLHSWLNQIQAADHRVAFPVIQEPLVSPQIQLSGPQWSAFQNYAKTFGVVAGRRQATLQERLHAGQKYVSRDQTVTIIWVQINMPPDEAVEHYYNEQEKRRERSSMINYATGGAVLIRRGPRRQTAEEKEAIKRERRTRRKKVSAMPSSSSTSSFSPPPQPTKHDGLSQRRMNMINKTRARNEVLRREGNRH